MISGEKTINAHRVVLSATSDYFAAMFMTDLKESSQREVTLHEMDGDILHKLIHYCYTGIFEIYFQLNF